jgi:hypothetical protein
MQTKKSSQIISGMKQLLTIRTYNATISVPKKITNRGYCENVSYNLYIRQYWAGRVP